jgi:hypothetical protein
MRTGFFFIVILAAGLLVIERACYRQVEDIKVQWNRIWGEGKDGLQPIPFQINASCKRQHELERKLDDFLSRPAPAHQLSKDDLDRGLPYLQLRSLVHTWRSNYSWPERAKKLNDLGKQYLLSVNGLI